MYVVHILSNVCRKWNNWENDVNISFTDFSVDQEMAQLGFGIFIDQHGDPSWLMSARDFQSMFHDWTLHFKNLSNLSSKMTLLSLSVDELLNSSFFRH